MSFIFENICTICSYYHPLLNRNDMILSYEVIPPDDFDDEDFCHCYWCTGFRNVLFFTYRRLLIVDASIIDAKTHEEEKKD